MDIRPSLVVPVLVALSLTLPAPAVGQTSAPGSLGEELDRYVERAMERLDVVPGVAVAVVAGDSVVLTRGYGWADVETRRPVTPSTVFYIASSVKGLTGTLAAILAERGRVDLDAPVGRYLPGLDLPPPLDPGAVTLRGLLTHTSGMTDTGLNWTTTWIDRPTDEAMLAHLARWGEARSGFAYQNFGFALAGRALAAATGEDWRTSMRRHLFEPLGMRSTSLRPSEVAESDRALPYLATRSGTRQIRFVKSDETITAAGGAMSTVEDLARFVMAMMNGGRLDGREVLPKRAVREAIGPHVELDAAFFEFKRTGYGLGWYHATWGGERLVHHFGGLPGYRCHLSFLPDRRFGVVVLGNEGRDGNRFADLVATWIYDRFLERSDARTRAERRLETYAERIAAARTARAEREERVNVVDAPAREPGAYVGVYENERLTAIEVRESSNGLVVEAGNLRGILRPVGGDAFVTEWLPGAPPVRFEFAGGSDGPITRLDWGGRIFRARR